MIFSFDKFRNLIFLAVNIKKNTFIFYYALFMYYIIGHCHSNCIDFCECKTYNSFIGMHKRIVRYFMTSDRFKLFKDCFNTFKIFKTE